MIRTPSLALVVCVLALSACQSNSQGSSGVVVSPVSNTADGNQVNATAPTDPESEQVSEDAASVTSSASADTASGPASNSADSAPAPPPIDTSSTAFETDRPQTTGNLENPELTEVSGLAASTRQSNTLWAINDSGNQPKVFALNHQGESLGNWTINVDNRDWEDLASAWINGESYLFIADIGDNATAKDEHVVHVITEPFLDSSSSGAITPLHTIRFRYPGSRHNAESLAIGGNWLYILTKEGLVDGERQRSRVYRVPLSLSQQTQTIDAELIAQLAIPDVSFEANVIASLAGVDVTQPTAFDIDQNNRTAYLLTYRSVYRYDRTDNQSWAEVLAQPRTRVHSHSLAQAEALAVSENGVVWFTTEQRPAPLWALPGSQ